MLNWHTGANGQYQVPGALLSSPHLLSSPSPTKYSPHPAFPGARGGPQLWHAHFLVAFRMS